MERGKDAMFSAGAAVESAVYYGIFQRVQLKVAFLYLMREQGNPYGNSANRISSCQEDMEDCLHEYT
jgi:hypothetical protein